MTTQSIPGSRWWKFDFHTHTPAGSDDYRGDPSINARKWLTYYRDAGLDCVVITDHNSGAWVDDVKAALIQLKSENAAWDAFYIFPGVEISCSGGIHLLAILDTDKTAQDIAALVAVCGYQGRWGGTDTVTTKSFSDVVDVIHSDQFNGVAIAAHVDQNSGLLCAVESDVTRLQFLDKIDAVQVVDVNKAIELISGDNTLAKFNTLAQVQGSDSHKAEALKPNVFTWVKLARPDLQGLKLALAEPELSIRRSDTTPGEPQPVPTHWIKNLTLQDMDRRVKQPFSLNFNPWLNTIIGGRGSGKSSIVECLRLSLGRGEEATKMLGSDSEISKSIDKFRDLKNGMIRPNTSLKVTVSGAGALGGMYRYDWSPSRLVAKRAANAELNDWTETPIAGDAITKEFPVRVFSQKQIYALANKPSGLLDYFDEPGKADKAALKVGFDAAVSRFRRERERVRELRQELKDWAQIKDQLTQVTQSLAAYAQQGINDKFIALQKVRAEKRVLTDFQEGLQTEIKQTLAGGLHLNLSEWTITLPDNASLEAKALVQSWHEERDALATECEEIDQQIHALNQRAKAMRTMPEYLAWETVALPLEQDCLQALEQVKAQLGGQLQHVGGLQQQQESLAARNKLYTEKSLQLQAAITLSKEAYTAVVACRRTLTKARQAFVQTVVGDEKQSILKIAFDMAAQFDEKEKLKFRELLKFTDGEYINIFLGNPDDEDSTGVLNILVKSPERLDEFKQILQDIVDQPEIMHTHILGIPVTGLNIKKALKNINDEQLDNLWLQFPADKIDIKFRTSPKDRWQNIGSGSAGQQTGALLSFILNEGDEPLILDQPEDDLDNAMVYDLVVQQLRKNKARRQVIVVTHNANIVVNGDAELVIPMVFKGGQIQTNAANGLQDLNIRQTICDVMEGGRVAFNQRYTRVLKDMN